MFKHLILVGVALICITRLIGQWKTRLLVRLFEKLVIRKLISAPVSFCYDSGCVSLVVRLKSGRAFTLIASGLSLSLVPSRLTIASLKYWITFNTSDISASGKQNQQLVKSTGDNLRRALAQNILSYFKCDVEITEMVAALEFEPDSSCSTSRQTLFVEIENVTQPWKASLQINDFSAKFSQNTIMNAGPTKIVHGNSSLMAQHGWEVKSIAKNCSINLPCLTAKLVTRDISNTLLAYLRYVHERPKSSGTTKHYTAPEIRSVQLNVEQSVHIRVSDLGFLGAAKFDCRLSCHLDIALKTPCASCSSWDPVKAPYLTYSWKWQVSQTTMSGELVSSQESMPELFVKLREHVSLLYGDALPLIKHQGDIIVELIYDCWPHGALDPEYTSSQDRWRFCIDSNDMKLSKACVLGRYRQSLSVSVTGDVEVHCSYLASNTDLFLWWLYVNQLYKCWRLNKKTFDEREAYFAQATDLFQANRETIALDEAADWFDTDRQDNVVKLVNSYLNTFEISRLLIPSIIDISIEKAVLILAPVPADRTLGTDIKKLAGDCLRRQSQSGFSHDLNILCMNNCSVFSSDAIGGSLIQIGQIKASCKRPYGTEKFQNLNESLWRHSSDRWVKGKARDLSIYIPTNGSRIDCVIGDVSLRLNAETLGWFSQSYWSIMITVYLSYFIKDKSDSFQRIFQRGGLDQNVGLIIKSGVFEISPEYSITGTGFHLIKDKSSGNFYIKANEVDFKKLKELIARATRIQLWYGTTRTYQAGPTGGEGQDVDFYHPFDCDIETKKLAVTVSLVELTSPQEDLSHMIKVDYQSLMKLISIFVAPCKGLILCYALMSKRLKPAFFPLVLNQFRLYNVVIHGRKRTALKRTSSCPSSLISGKARPLSYTPSTKNPQANSDRLIMELCGEDVGENPLIINELKTVILNLVSKLKGARAGSRARTLTAASRVARKPEDQKAKNCSWSNDEKLAELIFEKLEIDVTWRLSIEQSSVETILTSSEAIVFKIVDERMVHARGVSCLYEDSELANIHVNGIELVISDDDIISDAHIAWLKLLQRQLFGLKDLAPESIQSSSRESVPQVEERPAPESVESFNKVSVVSLAETSSVSSLSDHSECLTYVSSTNRSRPWLSIGDTQIKLWGNTCSVMCPFQLEVRPQRNDEYSLDIRGTCVARVFGTTVLKLRAPVAMLWRGKRLRKLRVKCVECHALPSVMVVLFQLWWRIAARFQGQRAVSDTRDESFKVEDVEIEQLMIRISPYLTLCCKLVNFVDQGVLNIASIRALQSITDPLCNHLACLHCNLTDLRLTEFSRLAISSLVIHFTPSLLISCLHHNILAYLHLLKCISAGASLTPPQKSPGLKLGLSGILSVCISNFALHIQETAFLTTRGKPVNPSTRKWLIDCPASRISPFLNIVRLPKDNGTLPDWITDCIFLSFLERDMRTAIPWQRSSPFQNSTYGFIIEAAVINVTRQVMSRTANMETTSELPSDSPFGYDSITCTIPDLLLKSRGTPEAVGRLDFEAVILNETNRFYLSVHKLLANLTRRQTKRISEITIQTINMFSQLMSYLQTKPDLAIFEDDTVKCLTPSLIESFPDSESAHRLVSSSSRAESRYLANSESRALQPNLNQPEHEVGMESQVESSVSGLIIREVTLTLAQGSIAFMNGDIQLLRLLITRLMVSESQKQATTEDKRKSTTSISVSDLMLLTCSPLLCESALKTQRPDIENAALVPPILTPLLAPLTAQDPFLMIMMTHHANRSQRRTKSVGRRKRFMSTLMGGGHKGQENVLSEERAKKMFIHMEAEKCRRQTEFCYKYDHIDVKLAPIEFKMAQKLLIAVHDYFSSPDDREDDNDGETSPNTDLLESLKAVEQRILKTTQLGENTSEEGLNANQEDFDDHMRTQMAWQMASNTPSSVFVNQIKISPIKMLLTYHGLLNINECQVSLNPFVLSNIEASNIINVMNRVLYHVMT